MCTVHAAKLFLRRRRLTFVTIIIVLQDNLRDLQNATHCDDSIGLGTFSLVAAIRQGEHRMQCSQCRADATTDQMRH